MDVARFQEQFGVDLPPSSHTETNPHIPQADHNHNTYQAAYAPEQFAFRFPDLDNRHLDDTPLDDRHFDDRHLDDRYLDDRHDLDDRHLDDRPLDDRSRDHTPLDDRSLDAVATICPDSEFARYVASRSGFNRMPVSQSQFNASAIGTHSMHTGQHPSTFLQHSFAPAQYTRDLTTMHNPNAQHVIDASAPCCKKTDFKSSAVTQVSFYGS